jgi:hypothetical protein
MNEERKEGGIKLRSYFLTDICNTLANVNAELEKYGVDTRMYPLETIPALWQEEIFQGAIPIEPMVYWIRQISSRCRIVYLTGRPLSAREITLNWLQRYKLPDAPLIHTNGRLKAEFVAAYSLTERVVGVAEDAPHELQAIRRLRPNIPLHIPDWPYNRHIIMGNRINIANKIVAITK